jgi:hypothetical protein
MSSELKVDKISPASGTSFTLGDSGDTYTVPSGATLSIAGTINASSGTTTGFDGTHVLLNTTTISDQANVTYNSTLITSTYKKYVVEFISCKLASDTYMSLFTSTDNGSSYGTSGAYQTTGAIFDASAASNALYTRNNNSADDLTLIGNAETVDNGYLFNLTVEIYDPTFSGSSEKGVLFRGFYNPPDGNMAGVYGAGTFRAGGDGAGSTAVNNIKFQAGSGNLSSGTVKLYGVQ